MSYLDIQEFLASVGKAQELTEIQNEQQDAQEQQELTRRKAGEGILSIKGAESFREGVNFKALFKDKANELLDQAKEKINTKLQEVGETIKEKVQQGLGQVKEAVQEQIPELPGDIELSNISNLVPGIGNVEQPARIVEDFTHIREDDSMADIVGDANKFSEYVKGVEDPETSSLFRIYGKNPDSDADIEDVRTSLKGMLENPADETEAGIAESLRGNIPFPAEDVSIVPDISMPQLVSPEITGALRGDTTLARVLDLRQTAEEGITGRLAQLRQSVQQVSQRVGEAAEQATSAIGEQAAQVSQRVGEAAEQATSTIAEQAAQVGKIGEGLAEKAGAAIGEATEGAAVAGEAAVETGLESAGASLIEDPFTALGGVALLLAGLFVGEKKKAEAALPIVSVAKQFGV